MSTPGTFHSEAIGDTVLSSTPTTSSSEESFFFRRETTTPEHNTTTPAQHRESKTATSDVNDEGTTRVSANEPTTTKHRSNTLELDINMTGFSGNSTDYDDDSNAAADERVRLGLVSENTEYLMSDAEMREWEGRIEAMSERLQQQREDYERWENGLSRRRMAAHERLKRLKGFHEQRVYLYDAVTGYISSVNTMLESQTS